jgi:hypothetical protein
MIKNEYRKEQQPLPRIAQVQEVQKRFGRQGKKVSPDGTKNEDLAKRVKVTAYK